MSAESAEPAVGAELVIDLDAFARNLDVLRRRMAPAEFMLVVKADAYGHGLLPVVRRALVEGVAVFGVLDVATGLQLRAAGVAEPVRLFAWLHSPEEDFAAAIESGIELGVSTPEQLHRIEESASRLGRPARLHLKFDSGLHRDGATEEEWPGLVAEAVRLQDAGLVVLVAAWSHLAEASDDDDDRSRERFLAAAESARQSGARFESLHLAASSAGWLRPEFRLDLVRIGAHAFGIPVPEGLTAAQMGLVPAMSLRAEVSEIADDPDAAGRLRARVELGYLHGLWQRGSGGGRIVIREQLLSLAEEGLAEKSAEVIVSEADAEPAKLAVGDMALFFGDGQRGEWTVSDWALATGTIGEELVCRLGRRLPRRYRGGGDER